MNLANPSTAPTQPPPLVPQLSRCKTTREVKQVHAHVIKTGLVNDTLAAAELLKVLALPKRRSRDIGYARKVFDEMPQRNRFSYNTIIRAFSESEDCPIDALVYFCRMCGDESVGPNRFTFPSVLKACAELGRLQEGRQVHGYVAKLGLEGDGFVATNLVRMYAMCGSMEEACVLFSRKGEESNVVLWNVMIDGCVKSGDLEASRSLFEEMPQRSVVSWNAMISGYAQHDHYVEAVELFRRMQLEDVRPNYVTLASVLPAISRLGAIELGKWVHLSADKSGTEINGVLGSALIDMYSKCGSVEKAVQVFEGIKNKTNVITWSTLINGLAMHGRARDAIDYFWRMLQDGVTPSHTVYIGLLGACSHAGLVDEGRSFFRHMIDVAGLEPKIEHYGCMVDLFGRSGLLLEAEQFILDMPIQPDDVIWKALLGACKMHGNVEMGERVAKILMEQYPLDSGSYVALSNMFASIEHWDDVADVRLKMKELDVRKDPGCSWIELDGVIHEFLVADDSHPEADKINQMLEEISSRLRLTGYRPQTTQVLLNVDEDEKEHALHYHSEKIAIAFGLISTAPGTPLRIVKNLRICDDCHSSTKLISELYNRKIVVRDRKRFHHFENGSCSCSDYW